MYQNPEESKLEVLARDPLWVNNDGKLHQIVNKHSPENIIRLRHCDGSHSDYRIGKNFTMIPEFGIILFKDANTAVKYSSLLETPEGQENVFRYWIEENRESNNVCMDLEDFDLPPGLYTIKGLDDEMTEETRQVLSEIRYLNTFNVIDSKCKKPIQVTDKESCEVFAMVAKYFSVSEMNDENRCKFCRLIFEVYESEGMKKASVFPIYTKNIGTPYGFLRFSYLNGYPIFISQSYAVNFRNYVRHGKTALSMTFGERLNASTNAFKRREKHENTRNMIIDGGAFCLNNLGKIINYGEIAIGIIKQFTKKKGA